MPYHDFSQPVEGHSYPAVVIPVHSMRGKPVEWFDCNAKRDENWRTETLEGIVRTMKDILEHRWDNTYHRVLNSHQSFPFQVFGNGKGGYSIHVYDDLRGKIFHAGFMPDEEGKIPQWVIIDMKSVMDLFERGLLACRVCGKDYPHWQNVGKWHDSQVCSKECAEKSPLETMNRSK